MKQGCFHVGQIPVLGNAQLTKGVGGWGENENAKIEKCHPRPSTRLRAQRPAARPVYPAAALSTRLCEPPTTSPPRLRVYARGAHRPAPSTRLRARRPPVCPVYVAFARKPLKPGNQFGRQEGTRGRHHSCLFPSPCAGPRASRVQGPELRRTLGSRVQGLPRPWGPGSRSSACGPLSGAEHRRLTSRQTAFCFCLGFLAGTGETRPASRDVGRGVPPVVSRPRPAPAPWRGRPRSPRPAAQTRETESDRATARDESAERSRSAIGIASK